MGTDTRQFDQFEFSYTRYAFDFEGAPYAEYIRQNLEATLRANGELPPGISLQTPEIYRGMTGSGEIWLDEAGLPRFFIINLDLPAQPNGDMISAVIENEYYGFDQERIAQGSATFLDDPKNWAAARLPATSQAWVQSTLNFGLLLSLVFCGYLFFQIRQKRSVYIGVVIAVIFSLVITPLLQSHQVKAASDRFAARRAEQELRQQTIAAEQEVFSQIKGSNWDPHQKLILSPADTQPDQLLEQNTLDLFTSAQSIQSSSVITTTDTDGDGLSDADEAVWETCAYAGAAFCTGVADPTDSDGDGLSDGAEVNHLGTLPDEIDSDFDSINDKLEVEGFSYLGLQWYLNPLDNDTNSDGYPDGMECLPWSNTGSHYDPNAICPDDDGDGTPNVFDDDDDGDGVHDFVDLSPLAGPQDVYDHANPLSLQISGLEVNQPVFVDIQFRPTNADHLTMLGSVMDWPSGDDDGQIIRLLDTTFADTANVEARSTDEAASNGDLRFIPLLEITMPYQAGHYSNLPVVPAYQGIDRDLGIDSSDWFSDTVMATYGIEISETSGAEGELVAYVPVNLNMNENGAGPAAFSSRMIYWPSQDTGGVVDWGAAHEFRLVWMVQMLTNSCTDTADPDTCTDELNVIHMLADDFTVTGFQVSEEHGVDLGILYEDPAIDPDLTIDGDLWLASWNLTNTFLRGRDCDSVAGNNCVSDGNRDVTISNLDSQITSWSSGADVIEIENFHYAHPGLLGNVVVTETVGILETAFAGYEAATAPTFLFTQESTNRTQNLTDISGAANGLLTVDFSSSPTQVAATMSWASYQYQDGSWQNYEADDYLGYLLWALEADSFFQASDSSQTALEESEGKQIWAEMYYAALYNGLTAVVEVGTDLAWTESPSAADVPEIQYGSDWGYTSFSGASYVAYEWQDLMQLAMKSGQPGTSLNFWSRLKSAFTTQGIASSHFVGEFKAIGRFNNSLYAAMSAIVVIGFSLFTAGFASGDSTLLDIGEKILSVASIVIMSAWFANWVLTVFRAWSTALTLAQNISTMSSFVKGFRGIGLIGLVLQVVVAVGLFFYAWASGGLEFGSPEWNMAFAFMIAQIVVIVILFAIEVALGALGPILIVLLILDLLIYLITGTSFLNEVISAFASVIYDVDEVITNLDDGERLEMGDVSIALVDETLGFEMGNGVQLGMNITNTLEFKGTSGDAKEATTRYYLQTTSSNAHSDLDIGDMKNSWTTIESYISGGFSSRGSIQATLPAINNPDFMFTSTGLNMNFSERMYLVEGFAIPFEECWLIFGCSLEETSGSNPIHIGEHFAFDVLPQTLAEFISLSWNANSNLSFPAQKDWDNDGLLSTDLNGTDPNDERYDTDGDTLSDRFEQENGTSATAADSDGDGLSDAKELFLGTNPLDQDTDGDNLNDYLETELGWLVEYESGLVTRVWSNPAVIDMDGDGLNDLEEYTFSFNPNAATDPSIIADLVQFDNIQVSETNAPILLLHLEEENDPFLFFDSSGANNTGECDQSGNECPVAEQIGRYGNAVKFDGSNDHLQIGGIDLANKSFTLASWVNRDATLPGGVFDQGTDINNQNLTLKLSSTGAIICQVYGEPTASSGSVVTNDEWHHIACTYDADSNSLSVYHNGRFVNAATLSQDFQGSGTMDIGRETITFPLTFKYHHKGLLDEIFIAENALTPDQINNLYNGRYNPNDLIVLPGDELFYQATVTNTHTLQRVDGYLVPETTYVDPGIGTPLQFLSFDSEDSLLKTDSYDGMTFYNASPDFGNDLTCDSAATCPTFTDQSIEGGAIDFDGSDDYVVMKFGTGGWADKANFVNFYVNVELLPSAGNLAYLFDSIDAQNIPPGADIYLNASGQVVLAVGGDIYASNFTFDSNTLNTWVHLRFDIHEDYTNIWVDGELEQTWAQGVQTSFGGNGARIGNSLDGTSPFNGSLDRFIANFYPIPDIGCDPCSEADKLQYAFIVDFNNPNETSAWINRVTDGIGAECLAGYYCPAVDPSGVFSTALTFDNTDDYLFTRYAPLDNRSFTLAAWAKRAPGAADYDQIFSQGEFDLYKTLFMGYEADGDFSCGFFFDSVSSPPLPDDDTWHHWACTLDAQSLNLTLYLDGVAVDSKTSGGYQGTGTMYIGKLFNNENYFNGSLDEIHVLPEALGPDEIQLLMNSQYPIIDITAGYHSYNAAAQAAVTISGTAQVDPDAISSNHHIDLEVEAALQFATPIELPTGIFGLAYDHLAFEEVPAATTFSNIGFANDVTCTGTECPNAGLMGMVDRAAYFDGVDDYLDLEHSFSFAETIAFWVKGDQGVIFDSRAVGGDSGFLLTMNNFWIGQRRTQNPSTYVEHNIGIDIPENVWTHVVLIFGQTTGDAQVYINGELVVTEPTDQLLYPDNYPWCGDAILGKSIFDADHFRGYLDDFQTYLSPLSASEVYTLYKNTAPLMRFEFDEESEAAEYVDASPNGLIGYPTVDVCYPLTLDSVAINTLATNPSNLNIDLGVGRLLSLTDLSAGDTLNSGLGTILCSAQNLAPDVVVGGAATSLGSTNVDPSIPGEFNQTFSAGGNSVDLRWTVGSDPINYYNPAPGTDGKIGNTALFDGEGYIEVPNAEDVKNLRNNFTVMGWFQPNEETIQYLLSAGGLDAGDGFSLSFLDSRITIRANSLATVLTDYGVIEENIWHHIAFTMADDGSVTIYVDGVEMPTTGTLAVTELTPTNGSVYIGAVKLSDGSIGAQFHGEMDELAVYGRVMGPAEINSIYLRELRWFRDHGQALVRVDSDDPAVTLLSTDPYYMPGFIMLGVQAVDVTSDVNFLDFGVKGPSDASFTWTQAARCLDGAKLSAAAFCPSFTAAEAGTYQLEFRAVDSVGNETVLAATIYVDDTPPEVFTSHSGEALQLTSDPNVELAWTVHLNGTISDDLSGVLEATEVSNRTMKIALLDSTGKEVSGGEQEVQINSGEWEIDYRFVGAMPHGEYQIWATAYDNAGNKFEGVPTEKIQSIGKIFVDGRAPQVEFNSWAFSDTISSTTAFSGTVIELIDPANTVAQYHFEEPAGATKFYDNSNFGINHASCITCPTAGVAGQFGNAVEFGATTDWISIPHVINPISTTFTAALWFKASDLVDQVLIQQQDGSGNGHTWLKQTADGELASSLGGLPTNSDTSMVGAGAWYHVAVSYDGATLRLYRNGILLATAARTMQSSDGDMLLGIGKDMKNVPFEGLIDEVSFYNRDLTEYEILALAQSRVAGVESVEAWLAEFPFTETVQTPSWQPAVLADSGADTLATTWQYTITGNYEYFYELNVQGVDTYGNSSPMRTPWRGVIDTLSPRIVLTATHTGTGESAVTNYSFVIDDLFLDEMTIVHPCEGIEPLVEEYHAESGFLMGVSGSCQVPSHISGEITVTACDFLGNCSSETKGLTANYILYFPLIFKDG